MIITKLVAAKTGIVLAGTIDVVALIGLLQAQGTPSIGILAAFGGATVILSALAPLIVVGRFVERVTRNSEDINAERAAREKGDETVTKRLDDEIIHRRNNIAQMFSDMREEQRVELSAMREELREGQKEQRADVRALRETSEKVAPILAELALELVRTKRSGS